MLMLMGHDGVLLGWGKIVHVIVDVGLGGCLALIGAPKKLEGSGMERIIRRHGVETAWNGWMGGQSATVLVSSFPLLGGSGGIFDSAQCSFYGKVWPLCLGMLAKGI